MKKMKEMQTPIKQGAWRNIKPGNGIKDSTGRIWKVTQRDPAGDPDVLFAVCPGHHEDRLLWCDNQLLDEEYAIVMELNSPSVAVVA